MNAPALPPSPAPRPAMDVVRARTRTPWWRRRVALVAGGALLAGGALTVALALLPPAAPSVDPAGVWIDEVRRGELVRDVEAQGALVPEDVRLLTAPAAAVVLRVAVQPGDVVAKDDVLAELDSPELALSALEAERELGAATAALAALTAHHDDALLTQDASLAALRADVTDAELRADADRDLHARGYLSTLEQRTTASRAEQLRARAGFEAERRSALDGSGKAAIAEQRAQVARLKEIAALRGRAVAALTVRAGTDGVVQALPLEVGQRLSPGELVAKVARPDRLRAELRVPEGVAGEVAVAMPVRVRVRDTDVAGRVTRVDPAVSGGAVVVDVALEGALPDGARSDMRVTAHVELERLADVLWVGRPASAAANGAVTLFRVTADGTTAERVPVRLGRASTRAVEVKDGLAAGDRVILSDLGRLPDGADHIRLQ